jgi:DNA-binding MarR family transcriptional regulator
VKRGGDLVYASEGGLSGFEWRILTEACEVPGQSINDLGKESDRSVAQVSRTVKRLIELDLLERRPVPGGHRVAIHPTSVGREKSRRLSCASSGLQQTLKAGISDLELAVFERVVSIMTQNAAQSLNGEVERP